MAKKRIKLAFLSEFQGEVNRGVETYVLELSKRLSDAFEVEILSGKDANSFKKITAGKYDVVIPTNGRMQALKASLGRLFFHYKVIISGQSGIGRDDILNIAVAMPDVYIALTEKERQWASSWAFRSKVIKIPNGVDLDKFSPAGNKAKVNLKGKIILSVGALHWYKHHERAIYAVSKTVDCSLLVVGSGEQEKLLTNLGNKLLGKERFLITKVNYDKIADYYRAVDLFTLPSWDREAFGIVYLEAMACNLPVVAPDDLARREIVGEGGILTDVQNPNKYASAILQALKMQWKDKPRKQAEKFSWDKIASQYKKLIEEQIK